MMFFGVAVQETDQLRRNNKICKKKNCTYVIDDMKLRYSQ